jgi:C-terminal processing protease CtpA/Prc
LHRVSAPAGVTRDEHWAQPTSPVSALSDARVFVLTGDTGSACEHLAQALRETGRATLVGTRTGGAGHYGGERAFGGRFAVFLPVGNSYAPGAQSWEGVGVQPHRNVPAEDALNEVLRELNVPASAAERVPEVESNRVVVQGNPPTRRYGIMMTMPDERTSFIRVEGVDGGGVAANAGLREGDRIVAVNGRAVSEMTPEALGPAMRASPLTLEIERSGARRSVAMSLD